ncbi:MAG: hypothetical protein K2P99_06500, partial [Burkholderiales bacterium]|nr:hypothetical protein [Burkholderiales bacterium]
MKKTKMRLQNRVLTYGSSLIVIYFVSFLIFSLLRYFHVLNMSYMLKEIIFLLMILALITPTIIAIFYTFLFLSASNIFMRLSIVAISIISYLTSHGMGLLLAKKLIWTSTGISSAYMNDILHIMVSTTSVFAIIGLTTLIFNLIFGLSCYIISDYKFHNKTHRKYINKIGVNYKIKKFIRLLTDKELKNTRMRSIALSMFFIFLLSVYITSVSDKFEKILLNSYLNHGFILNSPKVLCDNLPLSTEVYSQDVSNTDNQNNFPVIIRNQTVGGYVYAHATCS